MTCEGYDEQILHFTNLSMGQDQPDCYPLFSSCPLECLRMGEMIYMKVFRVRYKKNWRPVNIYFGKAINKLRHLH